MAAAWQRKIMKMATRSGMAASMGNNNALQRRHRQHAPSALGMKIMKISSKKWRQRNGVEMK
jgi:hypothetical protein